MLSRVQEVTYTTDPAVALENAKYIISSGGAPRKEGMTGEDLLKGRTSAEDFSRVQENVP